MMMKIPSKNRLQVEAAGEFAASSEEGSDVGAKLDAIGREMGTLKEMVRFQSDTMSQQSNALAQLNSLVAVQMEIIKDLKSEVAELKGKLIAE